MRPDVSSSMTSDNQTLNGLDARLRTESTAGDPEISEEFRQAIKQALQDRVKKRAESRGGRERFDIQLDRHEAKYVIPPSLIPEIREFIRPFCEAKPRSGTGGNSASGFSFDPGFSWREESLRLLSASSRVIIVCSREAFACNSFKELS